MTPVSTISVEPDEVSQPEAAFTSTRPVDYVPGILLLIGVGVLGKYAQIWWNALLANITGPCPTSNTSCGRS